jgi:hypothetical protein
MPKLLVRTRPEQQLVRVLGGDQFSDERGFAKSCFKRVVFSALHSGGWVTSIQASM